MPAPPSSRRERPAKPPLTREWIVAETIAIVRREGLERATMRRVAEALDTGPASLYVYVASTAELHAAVLDELLGSLPDTSGDWRHRLEALLLACSERLSSYPGLARSALVSRPTGSNFIALFDRVLALLLDGDVPTASAAWGADLLLLHVTATAAEHGAAAPDAPPTPDGTPDDGSRKVSPDEALDEAVRGADLASAAHVLDHADAVLAGPPEDRARWALSALISGIAATPTPLDPDPQEQT